VAEDGVASLLIVDAASPERDRWVETLLAAGHKLVFATNAAEALQLWRRDRHDLCVADEAAGGLELTQALKAELTQQLVPVILLVARPESRASALAVADDSMARPLDPAEVVARVGAWLRARKLVDELRVARAESEARTLADAATGLKNRVFLGERLNEEWKRAARYNEPLSLLLLSIEGLEAAAAAAGRSPSFVDRVLARVAAASLRSLRQIDVVTRFGAAELAALLPNTHFAGSIICAERLFREVARTAVDDWQPVVTMGVAFYPGKDVQEPADLLKLATRALDRAREEGAGSICLVQHQGYLFQPKKG
jgi:two-component system, cell cycle response regulator